MKTVFALSEEPGELVRLLADVAAVLRQVRAAGAPVPDWCLGGCASCCWVTWGRTPACTRCGSLVLAADVWHGLLRLGLAYVVARSPWAERRAA